MSPFTARRRWLFVASFAATAILILYYKTGLRPWILPEAAPESHPELKGDSPEAAPESQNDRTLSAPIHSTSQPTAPTTSAKQPEITWGSLPQHYPVHSVVPLPSGKAERIPRIQHAFQGSDESKEAKDVRQERRDAVREEFRHAWLGYKEHAWLKDEVSPISGGSLNSFGGLAATLVDALDSLWMLGFHEDFEKAVKAVGQVDFSVSEETTFNVFEYTIRYLGGLLGAYEISERKFPILLEKATEVGEMLYGAFDTPNRMPITRWEWKKTAEGQRMKASENTLVAELGSLSLEFTTLSRLSKDNKYFDAIQRITDELQKAQNKTKLPGMWPVLVDASTPSFSGDNTFTLGAMSDSVYEYLPKVRYLRLPLTLVAESVLATFTPKWRDLPISPDVRRFSRSCQGSPHLPAHDERQ